MSESALLCSPVMYVAPSCPTLSHPPYFIGDIFIWIYVLVTCPVLSYPRFIGHLICPSMLGYLLLRERTDSTGQVRGPKVRIQYDICSGHEVMSVRLSECMIDLSSDVRSVSLKLSIVVKIKLLLRTYVRTVDSARSQTLELTSFQIPLLHLHLSRILVHCSLAQCPCDLLLVLNTSIQSHSRFTSTISPGVSLICAKSLSVIET